MELLATTSATASASAPTSTADVFSASLQTARQQRDGEALPTQAASYQTGGFLVCLRVPEATEFGVDYEIFRTGPKFQGVKFLPLGVHFVIFRAREHEHGIRQGFFIHVERHAQVIAREWSAEHEALVAMGAGSNFEHLERAVLSFQLDGGLGAYPMQHAKTWRRLSKYISGSVLSRCGAEYGTLLLPGDIDEAASKSTEKQSEVVPFFPELPRTVCFTPLSRRSAADMTASERTLYHFDRSAMLDEFLQARFNSDWRELLGEFQLSFVVFLHLSSLMALEQWKQMTALLCSCEAALSKHTALFLGFAKTLRVHLEHIPSDFFDEELAAGNFLKPSIASLLELIETSDIIKLQDEARRLRALMQSRFHMAFDSAGLDDSDDEFAPVFVPPGELVPSTPPAQVHQDATATIPPDVTPDAENTAANTAIAMAFLEERRKSSSLS